MTIYILKGFSKYGAIRAGGELSRLWKNYSDAAQKK